MFSTLLFSFAGCCWFSSAQELVDLVAQRFEIPQVQQIGQAFNALIEVYNEQSDGALSGDCDDSGFANATQSIVEIWKLVEEVWELVEEFDINQSEIAPNGTWDHVQSVTINEAGEYRFDFYSDEPDNVAERNETNNGITAGKLLDARARLRNTNNYTSKRITILPSAEGTAKIEGKPIIEFH